MADHDRRSSLIGSIKDALRAASQAEDAEIVPEPVTRIVGRRAIEPANRAAIAGETSAMNDKTPGSAPSAADAAREARGGTPLIPASDKHLELEPPTTRVVRGSAREAALPVETASDDANPRTTLVRGRQKIERGAFHQDPVVGWLVVVGGPGLGAYRPIYEGNNTVGRSSGQRIPIDFGDDAISSEDQAYIRYDSIDRTFLFVPNLAKTNVVSVNDKKPTAAVPLAAMDVIGMGRTQLVFVPFCGAEFDWSELSDGKVVTRKERRS